MTDFYDDDEPGTSDGDLYEVQQSDYASFGSPVAGGLYEDDPTDPTGYYKIPSSDTSFVAGKTYYYIYDFGIPYRVREGVSPMSETAIAYSTYQTYLMYRTTTNGSYAKLVDIKDYPDLRQTPNTIDVTTLSHNTEKQIPGIIRMGDGYQFTANYTVTNFNAVKELEGNQYDYAVYFGGTTTGEPDGSQGVIKWTGDVFASIVGKGVDDAREMTITCYPSTDPAWSSSAS